MKAVKIQTNRVKIKSMIEEFSLVFSQGEYLVAPRPLHKQTFDYYTAFVQVVEGSKADLILCSIKNYIVLTENEFKNCLADIEHYWLSGDRGAFENLLKVDK